MKAAILGVNGYIGKHLAHFLQTKGWTIYGYDINKDTSLNGITYHPLNVAEKINYEELNTAVDFCFYFSGITGTLKAYSDYNSFIDVNEKGLLNLLDRLKQNNSKARVVFPSTRLIYKGEKDLPLKEDATKEFKTIYALNKWFGECVLQQYAQYFGIDHTIFRICVPYGSFLGGDYSYGTIGFFLKKAMNKENIVLYGVGDQKRTFTHVEDICRQIHLALSKQESVNEVFNIEGETFSLKDIADKIAEKFRVQVDLADWPEIDLKLESGDTIFDASRIGNLVQEPLKNNFNSWLRAI